MLDFIATIDDLENEAQVIDKFLNITCSEEPEEALSRGNEMAVYMARSGKMLADAKYWQDIALSQNAVLVSESYRSMPPSTKNKLIESMCQRENFLVNWIERLNKSSVHQLDWLRTVISKSKEELRFQSFGHNRPQY